ncbi:hypothetical protein Salat_2573300 [Sesamum alatum]|uniref:Uncharacterized protein n=1 Tax=Sesamum alatum TaxID=300844 RepID=A0AAE1XT22_9LAMI|nr:hypothetical protein Salat_2573300 [Sesamum alatum]
MTGGLRDSESEGLEQNMIWGRTLGGCSKTAQLSTKQTAGNYTEGEQMDGAVVGLEGIEQHGKEDGADGTAGRPVGDRGLRNALDGADTASSESRDLSCGIQAAGAMHLTGSEETVRQSEQILDATSVEPHGLNQLETQHGIADWVWSVLQQLDRVEQGRFLVFCWMLWKMQCKKVMENYQCDVLMAVNKAELLLQGYTRVRERLRTGG